MEGRRSTRTTTTKAETTMDTVTQLCDACYATFRRMLRDFGCLIVCYLQHFSPVTRLCDARYATLRRMLRDLATPCYATLLPPPCTPLPPLNTSPTRPRTHLMPILHIKTPRPPKVTRHQSTSTQHPPNSPQNPPDANPLHPKTPTPKVTLHSTSPQFVPEPT